jgi:cytoskeletal protein CcmA (bactofilin family)
MSGASHRDDRAGAAATRPIENGSAAQKNLQHVVAGDSAVIPLVPADGVFEGQVSVQGETRIDGLVRGTLRGTGRLDLGPTARVEGTIECEDVCSQGAIVGPVVAHQRAELGPGASLEGDLDAPTVKVADSAVWNGRARVGS